MTDDDRREERLRRLDPFVGEWQIDAPAFTLPPDVADQARMSIGWILDGAFLLQRSSIPVPGAPEGHSLIGLDEGDGYVQHYFDSRGIARVYAMTFDGREWTLERRTPDFSPLRFHQRWTSELSADGGAIEGRWEISHDQGATWELDFELVYLRIETGG